MRLARALEIQYTAALKQIKAARTRREWHNRHRLGDYPPLPDHPLAPFAPSPPTTKWVSDVWDFSVALGTLLERCELELSELDGGFLGDAAVTQGIAMGWAHDLNKMWATTLHQYHEIDFVAWDTFSVVGFMEPLLPLIGFTDDALRRLLHDLDDQGHFE